MALVLFFVFRVTRTCLSKTLTAPERHHHQPRHVDRGQQRRDRADHPQHFIERSESRRAPRLPKDLILRKETGPERHPPAPNTRPPPPQPTPHEKYVRLFFSLGPPMRRLSCSWCMPLIPEPEP